jgi:hypothetical protein
VLLLDPDNSALHMNKLFGVCDSVGDERELPKLLKPVALPDVSVPKALQSTLWVLVVWNPKESRDVNEGAADGRVFKLLLSVPLSLEQLKPKASNGEKGGDKANMVAIPLNMGLGAIDVELMTKGCDDGCINVDVTPELELFDVSKVFIKS